MIASATAEHFRTATEILLRDPHVDAVIVLTIHVGLADISAIARGISAGVASRERQGGAGKPVLTCIMDGEKLSDAGAT